MRFNAIVGPLEAAGVDVAALPDGIAGAIDEISGQTGAFTGKRDAAAEIVEKHLRPAFLRLLAEVKASCPSNTPTTAATAIGSNPAGMAAYRKLLLEFAVTYQAAMRAADLLYESDRDPVGLFRDTSAAPVSPPAAVSPDVARPAGPRETLARLLWLAHDPDAAPTLPTREERERLAEEFRRGISGSHLMHDLALSGKTY
jgi:hypothetical protein